MRDKNHTELRGRLGDKPKYKAGTDNSQSRASFSMCTNYEYRTRDGEKKTRQEWHRVVVWGKAADNASKYLVKGQQVEVAGRNVRREYVDKEGTKRIELEVHASQIEYGNKPKGYVADEEEEEETPIVKKKQTTSVRRKPTIQVEDDDEEF